MRAVKSGREGMVSSRMWSCRGDGMYKRCDFWLLEMEGRFLL